MNKHPFDMTPEARKQYERGYMLIDELRMRWGLDASEVLIVLQGIGDRIEEEKFNALHGGK